MQLLPGDGYEVLCVEWIELVTGSGGREIEK